MYLKKKTRIRLFLSVLMILVLIPVTALGAETDGSNGTGNTMELTLDQATDMALASSSDLKLADYDIELNEESREDAADDVKYTPTGAASDETTGAILKLIQSDITLQMSKKSKDAQSDSVVKSVFESYTDVLINQEKVKVAEKVLANAEFERLTARISYQIGKVSLNDKNQAESNYINKEVALNESRINLDKSYTDLNNLIGLNPEDRPVLKDDPEFVLLKIDDLESEVNRKLETNPSLWQSYKNVEKAQLSLELWNGSSSYRSTEIGVTKAEINAAEAKKTARQSLYDTYNNIRQQEEQYKTLEQSLKQAEDDLKVAQLKYELGMVSKGDVLSAELAAVNARLSLKSAAYQHEISKMTFDKPWA